jgi:type I restriction-modification system DNA methylase subunit
MKTTLQNFKIGNFTQNALNFFEQLGYNTEFQQPLSQKTYTGFESEFTPLNKINALVSEWDYVDQLFFLTPENTTLAALQIDNVNIDAYLIFGIELKKSHYSRGDLVKITREFNRVFPRPVLILFKHGETLTLSVIHRRLHKRDESKDVLEKVTLLKDIRIHNPHHAHLDILEELSFSNLKLESKTFVALHNAWQKVLNTKTLNKQFYEKLFDWYLFALHEVKVKFPQIRTEADLIPDEQHQSESLIRLLTRLLFVWFMKEKGLINAELFDQTELKSTLKNFTGENSNDTIFYKAILQNLFFATLNMPIEKRKVIYDGFAPSDYGNQLVYRYADLFEAENFIEHFENIPFLNGGLFDCLDQRKTDSSPEIRLDGFSTQAKKQAVAPDKLFFGEYKNVDLSAAYDNKKKSNVTVYGLIDILQNHKFTVEENTPLEEDIALDPELLGQVFENLLAAYNPETGTTARKQTGSFYTPREIVDYMVDESLIAYFKASPLASSPPQPPSKGGRQDESNLATSINSTIEGFPPFGGGQGGGALRELLNYENTQNLFDAPQTNALISAIDNLKILDPACGSGAFPMGILHKLVFVLSKLDPKNEKWRDRQIAKLKAIDDSALREKATQVIHDAFENNELDYGRKLFLIENCIHGVDIQPIATQISKLRFFISLIVDQKSHGDKSNNFGIRPLPNLDFKIIAANTLIAAPQDDFENNALFSNDSFFENFSDLTHDYFKVANPDEKRKLRDKIETLINAKCAEKIKAIDSLSHNEAKYKKQIDQLASHKKLWQSYANLFKHEAVAFFEPRYFFPQLSGGFDIVIGNPPYIFTRDADFSDHFKDSIAKTYFSVLTKGIKSKANQSGKINLFALFILKGIFESKKGGVVTYIVPNNLLRTTSYDLIRRYLLEEASIDEIVDLGSGVFSNVTASTVIFRLTNNKNVNQKVKVITDIENIERHEFKSSLIEQSSFLTNVSYTFNIFSDGLVGDLINKISFGKTNLGDFCIDIIAGIDANKSVISELKTDNSFPLVEGKTIFKYGLNPVKKFIIWDRKEINRARPDYVWEAKKKIIIQRISGGSNPLTGTIDTEKHRTFASVNNLLLKADYENQYEFFLALINSRVLNWFYANSFSNNSTLTVNISKTFLEKLPIPKIPETEQQPFIKLVDKILADKKASNDTSALEREIDGLVYGLYGLSEDEILIVEGEK